MTLFKRLRDVGNLVALRSTSVRHYQFERPHRDVPIATLVSPLRYDVLIRAEFFRFCQQHQELYSRDPDRFIEQAFDHRYHLWFCAVFCRRFKPDLLADERRRREAFAVRVKRSMILYQSFARDGFDNRYPITLRAGSTVEATTSGKVVIRPYYAGDGCHRLALLVASGQRHVPAAACRVKIFSVYQPLDNTHMLLSSLRLDPARYYSFIAEGYGAPPAVDRASLLAWVRQYRPGSLQEVEHVTAIDEPNLAQNVGS